MLFKIWDKKLKQYITAPNACISYAIYSDDYVICPSTGIKDVFGNDIYLNDILEWEEDLDKDCCYDDVTTYMKKGQVKFQNGVYFVDEDNIFSLSLNTINGKNPYVQIVGNIFTNYYV